MLLHQGLFVLFDDYFLSFQTINKIKEVETSTPLNMECGSNLNNNITNDNRDVKK